MIKKTITSLFTLLLISFSFIHAESLSARPVTGEEIAVEAGNEKFISYSDRLIQTTSNHNFERFKPGFPNYELLTLQDSENPEVQKFREVFLTPRYKKLLAESLDSAVEYRLYVRRELEKEGVPKELEYLPVVESYYKTTARSKSGALGMWQFMSNSVRPYLKLTEYVDERLDPWKETYAAIKKLQENYRTFSDWNLAIGAYNCGAGAMAKAVKNAEISDFWFIMEKELVPLQTRQYVPKLIAISDLLINYEYYEIDIPYLEKEYEEYCLKQDPDFDYLKVNNAYMLSTLAKNMRIDESILKDLNPSFFKGYTPPYIESEIRIPFGTLETATEALSKIDPINIPFKYKVVSGDTLWGISRKYNVTVKEICDLNGINENTVLSIGKILYIPSKLPR